MAKLRLPNLLEEGLVQYFNLSLEQRDSITLIIEEAPAGSQPDKLDNLLKEKTSIEPSKTTEIFKMLFSLVDVNEKSDVDEKAFVDDIYEYLKEKGIKAEEQTIENFKRNLEILFNNSSNLSLSKKVHFLTFDRQNLLSSSKILLDVRPIFGGEANDEIKADAVIFTLRVTYQEDINTDTSKSIFFSLDGEDLEGLKAQIIRAEMKAKKVKERQK